VTTTASPPRRNCAGNSEYRLAAAEQQAVIRLLRKGPEAAPCTKA